MTTDQENARKELLTVIGQIEEHDPEEPDDWKLFASAVKEYLLAEEKEETPHTTDELPRTFQPVYDDEP